VKSPAKRAPAQAPELDDAAIEKLAATAAIPKEQVASFGKALQNLCKIVRDHYHGWELAAPRREKAALEIAKVEKAANALKASFANLSDGARDQLGIYALRDEEFGIAATDAELRFQIADLFQLGEICHGRLKVEFFEKVVEDIQRCAATREWPSRGQGGARSKWFDLPGNPNIKAFDLFVIYLEQLIQRCGGHTTLDKNAGTGSLVDCLKCAKPYLPSGLVPDTLFRADDKGKLKGMSRLQRLKTGQKLPKK
jgi:hypothetical protein